VFGFDGIAEKDDRWGRLQELAALSGRVGACGVFDGDRLVALVGSFEVGDGDPAEVADQFLRDWNDMFGVGEKFELRAQVEVRDRRDRKDLLRLEFAVPTRGLAWLGTGVTVELSGGRIVGVYSRLPGKPIKGDPDPKPAMEAIRREFPDEPHRPFEPGVPTAVVVDPRQMFGEDRDPEVMFEFGIDGDAGPATVLVSTDGGTIIPVGVKPEGVPPHSPVPSYHLHPVTKVPDFITFAPTGLLFAEATTGDPERVARALFQRYPTLYGTGDELGQLELVEVVTGSGPGAASSAVVFQQRFAGVPVDGCTLRVQLTAALAIRAVTGVYFRDPGVSAEPRLPANWALTAAMATWYADGGPEMPGLPGPPDGRLVIVPTTFTRNWSTGNHLAWKFPFPDRYLYVSAHTGSVVFTLPRIHQAVDVWDANRASAAASAEPAGSELQFRDGIQQPGVTPDPDAGPMATAMTSVMAFWQLFGRNGWDGRGTDTRTYVDVGFASPNADSLNGVLRFDRTFVFPDIVAHEFTHSVVDATCDLVGLDEPGAANESYADVFGELAFPQTPATAWVSGDLRVAPATPIRNLPNPPAITVTVTIGGVPTTFTPPGLNRNWIATTIDRGGVHLNAGIISRAAVLLADGDGTAAHTGIGRDRLATVWYYTMSRMLHPWAGFVDVLHGSWESARVLATMNETGTVVPGTTAPPQTIDASVATEVLWAFQQVDLDLLLNQGWFHITGSFSKTETFYSGVVLPTGQTVRDVLIRARRVSGTSLLFEGVAKATGPLSISDGGSSTTVTIVSHGVNTPQADTVVTAGNPSAIDIALSPSLLVNIPPPPAGGTPPPPVHPEEASAVVHWCDLPFCGRRYRDVVYPTETLPAGCKVIDVELDLLSHQYTRIASNRLGTPAADGGGFGAWIVARTIGGTGLLVVVDSYHDAFKAVRYRLRYTIEGVSGPLPTMNRLESLR
jgi:hypothetical protein